MITIKYRVLEKPELAKMLGWTKKHLSIEFYVAGAWRALAWLTAKQLETSKWHDEVSETIKTNSRLPADSKIEFVKV